MVAIRPPSTTSLTSSNSNLTTTFFGYNHPFSTRVTVPNSPTEHSPSPPSYQYMRVQNRPRGYHPHPIAGSQWRRSLRHLLPILIFFFVFSHDAAMMLGSANGLASLLLPPKFTSSTNLVSQYHPTNDTPPICQRAIHDYSTLGKR